MYNLSKKECINRPQDSMLVRKKYEKLLVNERKQCKNLLKRKINELMGTVKVHETSKNQSKQEKEGTLGKKYNGIRNNATTLKVEDIDVESQLTTANLNFEGAPLKLKREVVDKILRKSSNLTDILTTKCKNLVDCRIENVRLKSYLKALYIKNKINEIPIISKIA